MTESPCLVCGTYVIQTDKRLCHRVPAIVAIFIMKDYPATTKFLSEPERTEVLSRLKRDRSSLADEFAMKYFWAAIGDWKIWVHMFITIGIYTGLYSFSLFLPTIVKDLGYTDPKIAQLMTTPPYVVACFFCVSAGWLADKMKTRGVFMIGFQVTAYVIGSVIFVYNVC